MCVCMCVCMHACMCGWVHVCVMVHSEIMRVSEWTLGVLQTVMCLMVGPSEEKTALRSLSGNALIPSVIYTHSALPLQPLPDATLCRFNCSSTILQSLPFWFLQALSTINVSLTVDSSLSLSSVHSLHPSVQVVLCLCCNKPLVVLSAKACFSFSKAYFKNNLI